MPKFFYTARDSTGSKIVSSQDAANEDELVSQLQAKGLIVVSVSSQDKEEAHRLRLLAGRIRRRHYRVKADDLVLFCRQLATLLAAGVTILKSLEVIQLQVASQRLYNVTEDLQKNMEAGLSFHQAMAKHPQVFSELWVNLVESGEASGNLAVVLNRLALYLERSAVFRKKIISALIYPVILMVTAIGALLFLTIRIIPTFAELFKGFNITLPALTLALIAVSNFIRKYLLTMVIITIITFIIFRRYTRTKNGRLRYERFKFRLPVFGEFFRSTVIERFSSEMSTLVESGVPILYSLEISEHSVGNLVMADLIRGVKEDVREGKTLSQPLQKSGFFEPMVVQMVKVGEEIGELSQMFKRVNAFYQEYTETFLTRFTAMFEPVMLIFMGLVVGIMVVGMFLPVFQIARMGGG